MSCLECEDSYINEKCEHIKRLVGHSSSNNKVKHE